MPRQGQREEKADTQANGVVWTLSKKVGASIGLGDLVPGRLQDRVREDFWKMAPGDCIYSPGAN